MKSALKPVAPSVERLLWLLSLGSSALALGILGAVLPVLPTTHFILLAAFSFGKSAPGLQKRLEASPAFGPAIRDWRISGAIQRRFKLLAIAMMTGVFSLSFALSLPLAVLAVQFVCMAGAAAFLLSQPNAVQSPTGPGEF